MRSSDFKQDAPGRFVPTIEGQSAFIPDPLHPKLNWNNDLASVVSSAQLALGRLGGLGQTMPNPHLLIRPFMRREAVLSSQIEGTVTSLSDLFLFDVDEAVEEQVPDVREVANYVRALERGLDRVKTVPLSRRLISEIHSVLMDRVRGGDRTPGEFRRDQVHIGPIGCSIREARYVPPPPGSEVNDAMTRLERYLHEPSDLPPVVRLAIVHYQFESIHPFQDGNGRVGRLLITLMLVLDGVLPLPLLYLSAYFERHRQEYYDQLLRVSQEGTWSDWVTFFARGVSSEAMDAVDRAERLRKLQAEYTNKIQTPRTSALVIKFLDALFSHPVVTMTGVAKLLEVTAPTAQKHIDRLVTEGVLTEITGRQRNRVFVAQEIIESIHEARFGH